MTTNARAFATELAGNFHSDEDRASTVYHPGQMTVGDYRSLDKVEPCEITGFTRVRTTPGRTGCSSTSAAIPTTGWSVPSWRWRAMSPWPSLRNKACPCPRPHSSDPDPIDRARGVDLASAGLAGYCAAVTVSASGEEHFALLAYNRGEADYLPLDWKAVAPHEIPGLPVYRKDARNAPPSLLRVHHHRSGGPGW